MKDTAQALYGFFSGFGINAYVENTVPENAELPYITYDLREPEPGGQVVENARVWFEDTGFKDITEKVDEIKAAIVAEGASGVRIECGNGYIVLWADEQNFCQFQPMDEEKIKCAYLTLIMGGYKL